MSNDEPKNDDDADDGGLFRRLMGDARPLQSEQRAAVQKPRPRPEARFRRDDERAVLRQSLAADIDEIETGSGESLRYQQPSVGRRVMRKLARGGFSVQSEIDLHGMSVTEAGNVLRNFLDDSLTRGYTCIRVVHGKGLGSGARGPVLKSKVNHWLRQWHEVLAFVSTRQVDGGTGAVYVLLKRAGP